MHNLSRPLDLDRLSRQSRFFFCSPPHLAEVLVIALWAQKGFPLSHWNVKKPPDLGKCLPTLPVKELGQICAALIPDRMQDFSQAIS